MFVRGAGEVSEFGLPELLEEATQLDGTHRIERIDAPGALRFVSDQRRVLEDLQVLRHRRARHRELLRDGPDRSWAGRKHGDNGPPGGVAERLKLAIPLVSFHER